MKRSFLKEEFMDAWTDGRMKDKIARWPLASGARNV